MTGTYDRADYQRWMTRVRAVNAIVAALNAGARSTVVLAEWSGLTVDVVRATLEYLARHRVVEHAGDEVLAVLRPAYHLYADHSRPSPDDPRRKAWNVRTAGYRKTPKARARLNAKRRKGSMSPEKWAKRLADERTYRARLRAEMTPEELLAFHAAQAERLRVFRAKGRCVTCGKCPKWERLNGDREHGYCSKKLKIVKNDDTCGGIQ